MMSLKSLLLMVFSGLCYSLVIYGVDDRREMTEEPLHSPWREKAQSIAVQVDRSYIISESESTGQTHFYNHDLNYTQSICSNERFATQPSLGDCTGFLIAPDKILTAGHCVRTQFDCDKSVWVFDYDLSAERTEELIFEKESVYSCKSILAYDERPEDYSDFSIIQLDRSTEREALKLNPNGRIDVGASVVAIGSPSGLPLKIFDNAEVNIVFSGGFLANLDTFSGNSGSPVFNKETGLIVGMHIGGEVDYTYDPNNFCWRYKSCNNVECLGEDIMKVNKVLDMIEN